MSILQTIIVPTSVKESDRYSDQDTRRKTGYFA